MDGRVSASVHPIRRGRKPSSSWALCSSAASPGDFQIRRKSRRDRMSANLREIKEALRERRHLPVPEVGKWLRKSSLDTSPTTPCRPTARRYLRSATMFWFYGTGSYAGAARGRTWCGSGWRNWPTSFSQAPDSASLAERAVCRQTPEVGAVCGNSARTDLCGGRPAMGVPTANTPQSPSRSLPKSKVTGKWSSSA